ncbi:MAG: DUF952 domain-containing protein [Planctomycetes bacterium]|nr:DUF952 domain-containing protein [Planctomycetota bacterium]
MTERIFHIMEPSQWPKDGSPHTPHSLDLDGFLHASFSHQLESTLALHFDPCLRETADDLWLLELDSAAIAQDLRVEASRGDESFPHLYRALHTHEVLRWWVLTLSQGLWTLPRFGESSEEDEPSGTPDAP